MMKRFYAVFVVALVAAQQARALSFDSLHHLLDSKLRSSSSLDERCLAYEAALRDSLYGKEGVSLNRYELLKAILDGIEGNNVLAKREGASLVLSDVRECLADRTASAVHSGPLFDRKQLVTLSKAYQDMKGLSLDQRCKLFDEQLRAIMGASNNPLASASKAVLLHRVISELGGRQLPFNNKQPFLIALEECANNLSEYQAVSGLIRKVIPGPPPGASVVPTTASPMERVYEEFSEVKGNIKDFGRDLYNKNQLGIQPAHKQHLEQHHDIRGHQENDEHKDNSQHDEHSHRLGLNANHQSEKHRDEESAQVRELQDRLSAQVNRAILLESEIEQAQMIRSRLETQVRDLQTQLAKAQEDLRQTQRDRNNDDSNSDEDDDQDPSIDYSMWRPKKEKKEKKKKDKDDGKVYKDPVDIARKLQAKMNSEESAKTKCQKYYMALKYGGKVTKKFLEMLSQLRLPKSIDPDQDYTDSLGSYVKLLALSSKKNSRLAAREMRQCIVEKPADTDDAPCDSCGSHHHQIPVTFVNRGNELHNWHYNHAAFPAFPRFNYYNF